MMGLKLQAAILLCLLGLHVRAQEPAAEDLWRIPGDPIAYWAFDPSFIGEAAAADPNRALAETVLLRILRNIMPGASPSPALEAILQPRVLGANPYRLSLHHVFPAPDQGAGIRAGAVLQIFTGERHAILEAAIRDALLASDPAAEFAQEQLEGGASLTRCDALAWVQQPAMFSIILGELSPVEVVTSIPAMTAAFTAYRQRCAVLHPDGVTVFEAFVDLDRLRRDIPEQVGWGPLAEVMHAWRISNARAMMLRARATSADHGPSTIHAAVAWAGRTEPPVRVRSASITHASWPQPLGPPPAGAAYFAAFALPPQLAISLAVNTYEALAPEDRNFGQRKLAWARNLGPRLERVIRDIPAAVVICGPGHSIGSPPLLIPATHTPESREDVRAVFASISPTVSWNESERYWSVRTGASGLAERFLFAPTATGFAGGWNIHQLPPRSTPPR